MGVSLSQRIVDRLDWLDSISGKLQPVVKEAVGKGEEKGGATVRNLLDGTWLGVPLHPILTDVPVGSWTAALFFDGLDIVSGSKATRNAADAALAVGIVGGYAAAVAGFSDWRYLSGGASRFGMAHALLNAAGLTLSTASLVLRATGRRNAGRLAFLAGFSINGMGAHLGGELSYRYGLRVNRNVFEWAGPDKFTAVLREDELTGSEMRRVELEGDDGSKVGILITRTGDDAIHAISATCNHFSGPLEQGDREGDTVICPWHLSRFDLSSGEVLDGPATFAQSRYHTRVQDGNIEIKADEKNIQKRVR